MSFFSWVLLYFTLGLLTTYFLMDDIEDGYQGAVEKGDDDAKATTVFVTSILIVAWPILWVTFLLDFFRGFE